MGSVKASKACNSQHDLPRLLAKKATIAILSGNQKLTKDLTKWDSAHKFGMSSPAQYKKDVIMMLHNAHHDQKAWEHKHDHENFHKSI